MFFDEWGTFEEFRRINEKMARQEYFMCIFDLCVDFWKCSFCSC